MILRLHYLTFLLRTSFSITNIARDPLQRPNLTFLISWNEFEEVVKKLENIEIDELYDIYLNKISLYKKRSYNKDVFWTLNFIKKAKGDTSSSENVNYNVLVEKTTLKNIFSKCIDEFLPEGTIITDKNFINNFFNQVSGTDNISFKLNTKKFYELHSAMLKCIGNPKNTYKKYYEKTSSHFSSYYYERDDEL